MASFYITAKEIYKDLPITQPTLKKMIDKGDFPEPDAGTGNGEKRVWVRENYENWKKQQVKEIGDD